MAYPSVFLSVHDQALGTALRDVSWKRTPSAKIVLVNPVEPDTVAGQRHLHRYRGFDHSEINQTGLHSSSPFGLRRESERVRQNGVAVALDQPVLDISASWVNSFSKAATPSHSRQIRLAFEQQCPCGVL